ncbi:hypothetical protein AXW95_08675 [Pseudomonas aeruginosa]|nr:hypothetical protein HMPREF2789_04815 [Pseudomonas aeruginosa]RIY86051.1 hypothetical protein AXW95_08675 [Pseudomonas aeruginosa]
MHLQQAYFFTISRYIHDHLVSGVARGMSQVIIFIQPSIFIWPYSGVRFGIFLPFHDSFQIWIPLLWNHSATNLATIPLIRA